VSETSDCCKKEPFYLPLNEHGDHCSVVDIAMLRGEGISLFMPKARLDGETREGRTPSYPTAQRLVRGRRAFAVTFPAEEISNESGCQDTVLPPFVPRLTLHDV